MIDGHEYDALGEVGGLLILVSIHKFHHFIRRAV